MESQFYPSNEVFDLRARVERLHQENQILRRQLAEAKGAAIWKDRLTEGDRVVLAAIYPVLDYIPFMKVLRALMSDPSLRDAKYAADYYHYVVLGAE